MENLEERIRLTHRLRIKTIWLICVQKEDTLVNLGLQLAQGDIH